MSSDTEWRSLTPDWALNLCSRWHGCCQWRDKEAYFTEHYLNSYLWKLLFFQTRWHLINLCFSRLQPTFVSADYKHNVSILPTVISCALDRISSYTVSLLKGHYSIDDVLSRVSFHLQLDQDTARTDLTDRRMHTQRGAVKPLPLLSFSNGKGYMAPARWHLNQQDEQKETSSINVFLINFWRTYLVVVHSVLVDAC